MFQGGMNGAASARTQTPASMPATNKRPDDPLENTLQVAEGHYRNGTMSDHELDRLVARVAQRCTDGAMIRGGILARTLVLVTSQRVNLGDKEEIAYLAAITSVAVRLADVIKDLSVDAMIPDPIAKKAGREPANQAERQITMRELANQLYRRLLNYGFVDASEALIL